MSSPHSPTYTPDLIRAYSAAALQNADELLVEASLLLDQGHNPRAYFLAVACIEETGKSLQAFDAQNRNSPIQPFAQNSRQGWRAIR